MKMKMKMKPSNSTLLSPHCARAQFARRNISSSFSAVHIEIFTGYHTLLADLQLTGQLLALFIGVGTVGKALYHSFKQRDSLFKWLMYPVWSISAFAVRFVVNLAMRGYEWIRDLGILKARETILSAFFPLFLPFPFFFSLGFFCCAWGAQNSPRIVDGCFCLVLSLVH
jgi:hypothetical protein